MKCTALTFLSHSVNDPVFQKCTSVW